MDCRFTISISEDEMGNADVFEDIFVSGTKKGGDVKKSFGGMVNRWDKYSQ